MYTYVQDVAIITFFILVKPIHNILCCGTPYFGQMGSLAYFWGVQVNALSPPPPRHRPRTAEEGTQRRRQCCRLAHSIANKTSQIWDYLNFISHATSRNLYIFFDIFFRKSLLGTPKFRAKTVMTLFLLEIGICFWVGVGNTDTHTRAHVTKHTCSQESAPT